MNEKPQNLVVVTVNGVKMMIDYATENVLYQKNAISEERSKLILCYLMDEGFLDEVYVKFQQSKMKTNK